MTILRRVWHLVALAYAYLEELVRGNLEMLRLVITPDVGVTMVVAVPLHTRDPWSITTFTNLVTLSPGSSTIEVAQDLSYAYVHVLTTRAIGSVRDDLMQLQRRVLHAAGQAPDGKGSE